MNLLRKLFGSPFLFPDWLYCKTTIGLNSGTLLNVWLSYTTNMLPLWSNKLFIPYMTGCCAKFKSINPNLPPFFTIYKRVSSFHTKSDPWGLNWPNKSHISVCGEKNILSSGTIPNNSRGKSVLTMMGKVKFFMISNTLRSCSSTSFLSGICKLMKVMSYCFILYNFITSVLSDMRKLIPSIARILRLQ